MKHVYVCVVQSCCMIMPCDGRYGVCFHLYLCCWHQSGTIGAMSGVMGVAGVTFVYVAAMAHLSLCVGGGYGPSVIMCRWRLWPIYHV